MLSPLLLLAMGHARAESIIEFKTSTPVSISVDGRQATLQGNLRQRVAGLEAGVHNLEVAGVFGKKLFEAEIELPDNTITYAEWAKGEIRVLRTEWLEEEAEAADALAVAPPAGGEGEAAEAPQEEGDGEGGLMAGGLPGAGLPGGIPGGVAAGGLPAGGLPAGGLPAGGLPVGAPGAPGAPGAEELGAAGEGVAAAGEAGGLPDAGLGVPGGLPGGAPGGLPAGALPVGAGAAGAGALAIGGVAALGGDGEEAPADVTSTGIDAGADPDAFPVPGVVPVESATALPSARPRTLTLEAYDGMQIEVVHNEKRLIVVVEGESFRIQDGNGLNLALSGE